MDRSRDLLIKNNIFVEKKIEKTVQNEKQITH